MTAAGPDARPARWPLVPRRMILLAVPVAVAVVTAVLGLHRIGERPFWHDEAFSMDAVVDGWEALAAFATTQEINMVVYYAALNAWLSLGTSDAWIRSLSVVFAVASVPAMYALARAWLGARVAVWATVLLGIDAFVIEYAQEARTYTLVLFLSIVAAGLLLRAVRGGGAGWWLAYAVAAILLVYGHVVAIALLPVHALLVLSSEPRPSWRPLVAVAVVLGIGLAPALWLAYVQSGAVLGWVPPPSGEGLVWGWTRLVGGGGPGPLGFAVIGWPILAAALAVTGAIAGWRTSSARRRAVIVLVTWVLLPVALGLVVSTVKPIIVVRYFIYLVPAIVLLISMGIEAFPARSSRVAIGVAAVILALSGTVGWYGSVPRPDWRAATAYLLANGAPTHRSMFMGDGGRVVVHYARQAGRADELPLKLWRGLTFADPSVAGVVESTAAGTAAEGRRLWLVVVGDASPDPPRDERLAGLWAHYRLVSIADFERIRILGLEPLRGS